MKEILKIINKIISSIAWVVFFGIGLLTIVVFIAQNSVPGDMTYPVKTGFENVLVKAYSAVGQEGAYQIKLTETRLTETQKVIATSHASQSISNLSNQISQTAKTITSTSNPAEKQQLADQYITTLTKVSGQLEQTKQQLDSEQELSNTQNIPNNNTIPTQQMTQTIEISPTQAPPTVNPSPTSKQIYYQPTPTTRPHPTETPVPTEHPMPTPVPTPSATSQNTVVTQIDATQMQIQQTIDTLDKLKTPGNSGSQKKDNTDNNKNDNAGKGNTKEKNN